MSQTVVHAEEWQYLVIATDSEIAVPPRSGTGLVDVAGQTAIITTGTDYGPVSVEWEVLTRDPGSWAAQAFSTSGWTEIAEFSIALDEGELWLFSPFDGPPDPHVLTENPASWRIRVHARGRDLAARHGSCPAEPIESHLLLLWEAPMTPVRLLRGTDEVGKQFGRIHRTPT